MYWMNYRAEHALRNDPKIIPIGLELMKLWRFFCSFSLFLLIEEFQLTSDQEGAVCSRRLSGINFRGKCWLELRRNRFLFAQELMGVFRFFIAISPILL